MQTQPETLVLTEDQENALAAFNAFLLDPNDPFFVLQGYSGCGKSTLVKVLIDKIHYFIQTAKLLDPNTESYEVQITATTNKAAENLSFITGVPVPTIHSFLGLRVQTNFHNNATELNPNNARTREGFLIFIDEASYIDDSLLDWIFKLTKNSKVVFIGDPAQLTPVKSTTAPVFNKNFTKAELTQVVRQAEGNPIVELSAKFRDTVKTGKFFSFKPDGKHIKHLPRDKFMKEIESEFTRVNWRYSDSKILAWTNKCVVAFNCHVKDVVKGSPEFIAGDYAFCNSFINLSSFPESNVSLKTDQLVQITHIYPEETQFDVLGNVVEINHSVCAFLPKRFEEWKAKIKELREANDYRALHIIDNTWIDLRAAYACTINKSQGSTFNRVFIDLNDVSRCNSENQIARMLYVGVSRAKEQVILTGDLV